MPYYSFCGFPPKLFGRKLPIKLPQGQSPPQPQECKAAKNRKENMKGGKKESSCNFILIVELREKIIALRDIFDLPVLNTSVSMDQLVIRTMKDLHKFYPESIPSFRISELKRLPLDKVLVYFCKALQGFGDTTKMSDGWMDKYKYDKLEYDNGKCKNVDKLVEIAVATLNGLIKMAREKFDMTDEDDENKELKESYSGNGSSCPSPVTPTSILPEMTNGSPESSSSALLPLRVKAEGKLNAVDVKRLALDKFPMFDKTGDFSFQNAKFDVPLSISNNVDGDKTKLSPNAVLPSSPSEIQPCKLLKDKVVAAKPPPPPLTSPLPSPLSSPLPSPPASPLPSLLPSPPVSPLQPLSASSFSLPSPLPPALPAPPSEQAEMSTDMGTDIKLHPLPPGPMAGVLPPTQPSRLSKDIGVDIRSLALPAPTTTPLLWPNVVAGGPPAPPAPLLLLPNIVSGRPPAPPLLQPNVVSEGPPLPPPLTSQQTVEAAPPSQTSATESKAAARIPLPLPRSPPPQTSSKTNAVATGAPLPPPSPVPLRSKVEPNGAPLPVPPPPPGTTSTMPQPSPPGAAKSLHPSPIKQILN